MKKFCWVLLIIFLILAVGAGFYIYKKQFIIDKISECHFATNFDECVAKDCAVLESYPRQCRTTDGKIFIEDIGNELEKTDLIRVSQPRPNDLIQSPLAIKGEAQGYWFFEASFPVILIDANGNEVGFGITEALSDWMTEDFVPFEVEIEFEKPATSKGNLILEKDNPSGLPENDDSLRIPVRFE